MPEKKFTFMSACRDFFGLKEGQTAMQFGKKVQELTPEDRAGCVTTESSYRVPTGVNAGFPA